MPGTPSKPIHGCPVAAFQRMISGKYKLRILWDLKDGPRRYGELRSTIEMARHYSKGADLKPKMRGVVTTFEAELNRRRTKPVKPRG
jgi:DNA-binding HxlR family transcriptional regulator